MISYKPKNNLDEHIIIPQIFPGISTYKKIKVFGCLPAVKMKNTHQIFLYGKWRYEPVVPIIIVFVSLFFFIMTSIFMLPKREDYKCCIFFLLSLLKFFILLLNQLT